MDGARFLRFVPDLGGNCTGHAGRFACLPVHSRHHRYKLELSDQLCIAASGTSGNQGGYFGAEAELQPLLHTWSLGVEEQFYIFFPIFLILIWKIKKNALIPIIIIGSLISFLSSQIGGNFKYSNLTINFPYFKLPFEWFWQAGMANFYLPFGRIWELMIGSLIAFYFQPHEVKDKFLNKLESVIYKEIDSID